MQKTIESNKKWKEEKNIYRFKREWKSINSLLLPKSDVTLTIAGIISRIKSHWPNILGTKIQRCADSLRSAPNSLKRTWSWCERTPHTRTQRHSIPVLSLNISTQCPFAHVPLNACAGSILIFIILILAGSTFIYLKRKWGRAYSLHVRSASARRACVCVSARGSLPSMRWSSFKIKTK